MPKRVSRREVSGQSGSLIANLLYREGFFRDIAAGRRSRGGIQRIKGSPDLTNYGGPSGLHSPYMNLITVAKDGGDFRWVTDALDYIQDADVVNPYTILLYPGIYDEDPVMKEYVALVGLDRDVCIIQSSSYQYLLTMVSHTSLNEVQVCNFYENETDPREAAIFADGKTDILIDHCIARCEKTSTTPPPKGLYMVDCNEVQLYDSRFYAKHNGAGLADAAQFDNAGVDSLEIEAHQCRFEIEDGGVNSSAVTVRSPGTYDTIVELLGCFLITENAVAHLNLKVVGSGAVAHAIACNFKHFGAAAGYDLHTTGGGEIYVRGGRYETWFGNIYPLAGDRPRLECREVSLAHSITAGAGVWENTNCSDVIDLPCESDLKVICFIRWRNSTDARTLSTKFRIDLDGASQAGDTDYLSADVIGHWNAATVVACFSDVATGNHTITVQTARNNAGDAITLGQQNLSIESVPWP